MSIDKRPNGRWRVRYPGAPSKTFDRKGDAEEYERTVRRAKQTGRVDTLDADLKTLADLAADHMQAVAGDLAPKTFETYRSLWSAHVDASVKAVDAASAASAWRHGIASMSLRQLRPREIEKWKQERLADGAGPQSIRKTMALMQTIFDRAVRDEAISSNPVKLVKKPSGRRVGTVTVVPPEIVERIRNKLDDTGAMMVSLLAYSGMRPGEARALRWEHIGKQSIRVEWGTNPDGSVKPTKTETMRTVRLIPALATDLKAWRTLQGNPGNSSFVFPGGEEAWTEDAWRNWRSRKFEPAAKAAGVTINRPYDLRHSAASLWLHEGVNPVQVAAWLGHNVSETFKTYAHVISEFDPAERKSAADVVKAARQDTSRTTRVVQPRPQASKPQRGKTAGKGTSAVSVAQV